MKVIIDCDPGIDDVYALSVALQQENIDILAITIASGNTSLDNGALNAKLTLDKLFSHKKHSEIFLGAEKSLSKAFDFYPFFNIDGLGGSHQTLFKNEIENLKETFLKEKKSNNSPHAANKIVELVNKYPNEITIIALAPLANLALALKVCDDPDAFTKNIKRLVIMGGNEPNNFSNEPFLDRLLNYPEFNFEYDSIAAKTVLDTYSCPITIYTYDCCLRSFDVETAILIDEFNNYIQTSKRCNFLERIGIPHRLACVVPRLFFSCDLVTVIGFFHGEECKAIFQKLDNYTIQANSGKLDGLLVKRTDNHEKINPNVELCVKMDSSKTFEIFKTYLDKLKQLDKNEEKDFQK